MMGRKENRPPLMEFFPRPGMREIRTKSIPAIPLIRNERMIPHGEE